MGMTKAEHRKALMEYKEYVIGMFDKININRYENLNALLDKKSSKHHAMIKEYHSLGKKLHNANDVFSIEEAANELSDFVDKYDEKFI